MSGRCQWSNSDSTGRSQYCCWRCTSGCTGSPRFLYYRIRVTVRRTACRGHQQKPAHIHVERLVTLVRRTGHGSTVGILDQHGYAVLHGETLTSNTQRRIQRQHGVTLQVVLGRNTAGWFNHTRHTLSRFIGDGHWHTGGAPPRSQCPQADVQRPER